MSSSIHPMPRACLCLFSQTFTGVPLQMHKLASGWKSHDSTDASKKRAGNIFKLSDLHPTPASLKTTGSCLDWSSLRTPRRPSPGPAPRTGSWNTTSEFRSWEKEQDPHLISSRQGLCIHVYVHVISVRGSVSLTSSEISLGLELGFRVQTPHL